MLIAAREEIEQFVSALFRYAEEGTYVSLRSFDQHDRGKPPVLIQGIAVTRDLSDIIQAATTAAEQAANVSTPAVFAPPVATFNNPRRARVEDLACGVALSVEIDQANPVTARSTLEHLLGPVTIGVASGGEWIDPATGEIHNKMHLHWRLSEPTTTPEDHKSLERARELAAMLVSADFTAVPVCHPLRWPGSWNRKGAAPRLAMIQIGNPAAEVHLDDALAKLEEAVEAAGLEAVNNPKVSSDPQTSIPTLRSALTALPNADVQWDEWVRIGMAVYRASGGSQEGLEAWGTWSAKSGKHEPSACDERWAHFAKSPPSRIGAGTIYFLAAREGWQRPTPEQPDSHFDDPAYWAAFEADSGSTEAKPADMAPFRATPIDELDLDSIPPRQWIYGRELLRGFVSALGSIGGIGKTAWTFTVGVSVAINHPLIAHNRRQPSIFQRVHKQGAVWFYNLEDPADELSRRMKALMLHFGISKEMLKGRIFLDSGRDRELVITKRDSDGTIIASPVKDALIAEIKRRDIMLLIVDPFVQSHTAVENNNEEMNRVMSLWSEVAHEANCAVWLIHHFRKGGQAGDGDSFRGAAAIQGAARVMSTLGGMTPEEADKLGIKTEDRRRYIRLDNAKANMSPPAGDAEWYQLINVEIGNANDDYPEGDHVQTVEPWTPESAFSGISWQDIDELLNLIQRGPSPRERYAAAKQAGERWVGTVFTSKGKTPGQAATIVKAWLSNGLLAHDNYKSPSRNYATTSCVTVDQAKAAEMRANNQFPEGF